MDKTTTPPSSRASLPRDIVTASPEDTGRYTLLRPLGEGGMAYVYLAHDKKLDRAVAIKIPRSEVYENLNPNNIRRRFVREMESMLDIRHPNIVRFLGAGLEILDDGDNLFFVMEYVPDSQDLLELIMVMKQAKAKGPIKHSLVPTFEIYRIMEQLLDALAVIHARKLVHRDLKPHNILYSRDQHGEIHIKLMDFGIAKRLQDATGDVRPTDGLTQQNVIVGTPEYLAPEQANDAPIDARTDLYAVGAIAYELVTGQTTINRRPLIEMVMELLKPFRPEKYPSRLVKDMNPVLEKVILDLLERYPDRRIQTAQEARMRFREAEQFELQGEVSKPPPAKRSFTRPIILLGALLLGLCLTIFAMQSGQSSSHEEVIETPVAQLPVVTAATVVPPSVPPPVLKPSPPPPPAPRPQPPEELPENEQQRYLEAAAAVKSLPLTGVCPISRKARPKSEPFSPKAELLSLIQSHPKVPGPYYWAAECLRREGKVDKATLFLQRYKELAGHDGPPP